MTIKKAFYFLLFAPSILILLGSCKDFKSEDYSAYFGGEVTNPTNPYILFCKDSKVIDTIKLDKNNRFFIKFDSLTPGMYSFKHEPEYQYVYFDKNDSLMVSINSRDFDNSIVFSGRGDQKNNFLMELFLTNEKDRETMFMAYDDGLPTFNKAVEKMYNKNLNFYKAKKDYINWTDNFDVFAKAALEFPYYSKKELYPVIHHLRTGNDVIEQLPKDYYAYRKDIDFNNTKLTDYAPFVRYLSHMLSNVAAINYHNHFTEADLSLKISINKLNITDTLIKNEKIKNTILNNIAFTYLLEDQNMMNNQKFLETYHKYSTDRSQKNEITKIGNAIQLLKAGNRLPNVSLVDTDGKNVSSDAAITGNTVIFFWTDKADTHLVEAHRKVLEFKAKYPNYHYVAVNLDDNQEQWKDVLSKYKFDGITELRTTNFEDLKAKWAITKIHRTIVLGPNGNIKTAFTNIFDKTFEDQLKVTGNTDLSLSN